MGELERTRAGVGEREEERVGEGDRRLTSSRSSIESVSDELAFEVRDSDGAERKRSKGKRGVGTSGNESSVESSQAKQVPSSAKSSLTHPRVLP